MTSKKFRLRVAWTPDGSCALVRILFEQGNVPEMAGKRCTSRYREAKPSCNGSHLKLTIMGMFSVPSRERIGEF
jgi:hypothetical protein